jgi:hypothetical protein
MLIWGAFLISLTGLCHAQDLPNPWQTSDKPLIGPTPVPVMEQMFWVQLPIDPATQIQVQVPDGVSVLDRTRPGQRPFTRIYMRADSAMSDVQIAITAHGAEPITVSLTVKSYREDLEEQLLRMPDIDGSVRKLGRSYFTDELIAVARQNMEQYPELIENLQAPGRFDTFSDDELWAFFPSWNVPRDCYGNWPCPKCGEEIYKVSGFYPWQRNNTHPFKARCPVCDELFPSNDYLSDDFTSGDHPDDGWGYDAADGDRSKAAAWVAYYNHHQVWQSGGHIENLALRYLLLGDEEAAYRAGILLARLAYVYPGLNYRWQQSRSGYLGRTGRALIDGNWERGNLLVPALRAYDAIFEHLDNDTKLVVFLQQKDPSIQSPADVKALLDTALVQVCGWDWIHRELTGGSQGSREQDMAEYIVCANMGEVSDRWLDELFTHAWNGGLNKGGFDDAVMVNALARDGHTLVSGLGYALGYQSSKSDMAEIMSRVVSERWSGRANLFDERLYPKLRAEFDLWIDMEIAGQFTSQYGDSGGGTTSRSSRGLPASNRAAYERAYRRWPDERIARAIYRAGPRPPRLFEPDVWQAVQEHVERVGPQPPLESRVMDGVGFVMLESRPHSEELADRAGVAFRYGYALGHHHNDNLNVELFAHGENLAPELGYPTWAHPLGGTGDAVHHCTGMIDRSNQYPGAIGKGWVELFSAAPEASFADLAAAPSGFPNRMYRRAICLADAPEGNIYLFDVLRMAGGSQRTWCFHGPMHDQFEASVQFGPEAQEPFSLTSVARSLNNNILAPQQARADDDVWADWKFRDRELHIRTHLLGEPEREYFTARYGKTDVPDIRFLFAEDTTEDGASEFVAIWEPYEQQPFIERIERLQIQGQADEEEFTPVAVRVWSRGGQVDTFIYSHDPQARLQVGDIEFQGSFGYWSEQDGQPRCLHLVNGSRLTGAGRGVTEAVPHVSGHVTAVDLAERLITVDFSLPVGDRLRGQQLYTQYGPHRTTWRIEEVLEPGNVIRYDLDSLSYRSKIEGIGDTPETLLVEMPFPKPGCGGPQPFSYYDGCLLTGEDLQAAYRIIGVANPSDNAESAKLILDRAVELADFPDIDGDGRHMAYIYHFGTGDRVTLFHSAFVDFSSGSIVSSTEAKVEGLQGVPQILGATFGQ